MTDDTSGHTNDQSAAVDASRARPVPVLGRLIDDLIKCREDVICELDLGHRPHALTCSANGETYQPLLTQGSVEDALGAKIGGQVHGATKDAAELDILAKDQRPLVGLEDMAQGLVDGGVQVYALCLPSAHIFWQLGVLESGSRSVVEDGCGVVLDRVVETGTCHCRRVPFCASENVLAAGVEGCLWTEEVAAEGAYWSGCNRNVGHGCWMELVC